MIFFVIALTILLYNLNIVLNVKKLDIASCNELLDLIGKVESRSNYNAFFGNSSNNDIKFTEMTISEVLSWQDDFVKKGSASSAVGKYQILNTTLRDLIGKYNIDKNEKFNSENQDKLVIYLLEKRGANKYVNKEITKSDFAKSLSQEWASLPIVKGDNPERSYYDGDGLNKALVKPTEVLGAISKIKPKQS